MKKVDNTKAGDGGGSERNPRPSPSSNIANSAAASGNIAAELEQVRLPGIINMDLEATKIRTGDEGCVVTEEKMLHLNIPLQISVDTKGLNSAGVYSPSVGKLRGTGAISDDRGRIPSSSLQPPHRSRTPSGRVRSASVGRDKKQEMAARYWAVLFENLRRSVDDLYRTCEGDESAVAAKEVLMVLENYVKDFKNLINWLKLNTEYEKTPAPARPTSLTWDIRKTSPAGRNTPTGSGKLTPTRQLLLCSPAKRQLNFDEKEENRSRTVSETIKESNREHEMSPSDHVDNVITPTTTERQFNDPEPLCNDSEDNRRNDSSELSHPCEEIGGGVGVDELNIEDIETDANVSEHEKSDSEQEKNKDIDEDSSDEQPDNDKAKHLNRDGAKDLEDQAEGLDKEKDNDLEKDDTKDPCNEKAEEQKQDKIGDSKTTVEDQNEDITDRVKADQPQEPVNDKATEEAKIDVPKPKEVKKGEGKKEEASPIESSKASKKESSVAESSKPSSADQPKSSKPCLKDKKESSLTRNSKTATSKDKTAAKTARITTAKEAAGTSQQASKSASNQSVKTASSSASTAKTASNSSSKAVTSAPASKATASTSKQAAATANSSQSASAVASKTTAVSSAQSSAAASQSAVGTATAKPSTSVVSSSTAPTTTASSTTFTSTPKTTFASTLKNSSKGTGSGMVRSTGNAPLTRALTTMSGPSTNSQRPPPSTSRKSTAGLLISSQKLQDKNRNYGQNRITLVARQTQFAQSNRRHNNNSNTNNTTNTRHHHNSNKLHPHSSGHHSAGASGHHHHSAKNSSADSAGNNGGGGNLPYGSSTSINSGSSSRSWADTVKGANEARGPHSDGRTHTSAEDLTSKGVDEEGWHTVRRARSRFSQTSSSSQASLKNKTTGGRTLSSKMKNRYNMPSSAVSMPSLASSNNAGAGAAAAQQEMRENQDGDDDFGANSSADHHQGRNAARHPALEKSASSASIVRNRDARVTRLGSVSERTGAGSSNDSVHDEDPSYIKKRKDEMNQSKQRILKKSNSTPHSRKSSGQDGGNSAPNSRKGSGGGGGGSPHHSRKGSGGSKGEKRSTTSPPSSPLKGEGGSKLLFTEEDLNTSADDLKSVSDLGQDTDIDTDNEEIRQRDEAIAKAESDAAMLQKELRETEQSELTDTDVETDTIATEDSGASCEEGSKSSNTRSEVAENIWEGLSWAEQMELEEQLAAADASAILEARLPGRAIHLHEKLSSPARKKEPHETFKHYQEKQDKARLRRQMFSEEKAIKLAQLNQKICEVLEQRDKLVDERKTMIENKLRKAEEKRIQHIEGIRRKAHEEEEKLKEIAFINELQAQNARIDMITQVSTADEKCEERLAVLAEEKAKKAEQREEREARAEERRREMEEARQRNLEAMISRRREREERIQGSQAAAREKRKVSARQKDKERLEKLSTIRAAETDMKEELKEKIMQKQEDAAKRHAEHLEDIRQKAFELSVQKCSTDEGVPIIKPYENKKKCMICNVLIRSEVHLQSHLRGKKHSEELEKSAEAEGKQLKGSSEITDYNIKQIIDAPEGETDPITVKAKERVKVVKRRAKKLKVKLEVKGEEFIASQSAPNRHLDSPHRAKIGKSLRDIDKLLSGQGKGTWPNQAVSQLERALGEITRSLDKNFAKDQDVFFNLGGFDVLGKIYDKVLESKGASNSCPIPIKAIVSCGKVLLTATRDHQGNCEFLLLSNRVSKFIELMRNQLTRLVPSDPLGVEFDVSPGPETDPLSKSVMQFLSTLILQLSKTNTSQNAKNRLQDLVSYIVSVETVDNLARYFQLVRNPIDSSPEVAEFLLVALQFLSSLTGAVHSNGEAHTLLLSTLQWTELAGTVSLLYGMLLHQGRDTARDTSPPPLPTHTLAVATETCTLLQRLVSQNLGMVQSVLASEGISLEFRHIASYLLWYSQCHSHTPLLNQVIILVGYFTANHADNQTIVQEGSQPSVLQQLTNLPFQYFSQPELKHVLFPTLLSCCHNNSVNMKILTTEMSWQLIEDFIKTPEAKKSQLVNLILPPETNNPANSNTAEEKSA